MTGCVVGRDRDELAARSRAVAARAGTDGESFVAERGDRWIVGTLDEVRARLAEYEAAGVERFFLQHLDHRDLEAVALIGELA